MATRLHPSRIKHAAELRRLGYTYAEIGRIMCLGTNVVTRALQHMVGEEFACRSCEKKLPRPHETARRQRRVLCLDCLIASPNPCFADRLGTHRVEAGFTSWELAKVTEMHPSTMRDLELGKAEPSWRNVLALVQALGMKLLLVPPLGPAESVRDRRPNGEVALINEIESDADLFES